MNKRRISPLGILKFVVYSVGYMQSDLNLSEAIDELQKYSCRPDKTRKGLSDCLERVYHFNRRKTKFDLLLEEIC